MLQETFYRLKALGHTLLLLILLSNVYGCAAVVIGGAAGAGTVVWLKGSLEQQINKPLGQVHTAALAAMKDLELPVHENQKDALNAKIRSQFVDGDKVWIDIESLTGSSSKIKIRVGVMGDEKKSLRILDIINRRLEKK